jgi:hypothetical protein
VLRNAGGARATATNAGTPSPSLRSAREPQSIPRPLSARYLTRRAALKLQVYGRSMSSGGRTACPGCGGCLQTSRARSARRFRVLPAAGRRSARCRLMRCSGSAIPALTVSLSMPTWRNILATPSTARPRRLRAASTRVGYGGMGVVEPGARAVRSSSRASYEDPLTAPGRDAASVRLAYSPSSRSRFITCATRAVTVPCTANVSSTSSSSSSRPSSASCTA